MKINPEVALALKEGRPVVALESTIISHGMPYPKNVETALLVEKTVRENGAIPATMGIIAGEPIVGMKVLEAHKDWDLSDYGYSLNAPAPKAEASNDTPAKDEPSDNSGK